MTNHKHQWVVPLNVEETPEGIKLSNNDTVLCSKCGTKNLQLDLNMTLEDSTDEPLNLTYKNFANK